MSKARAKLACLSIGLKFLPAMLVFIGLSWRQTGILIAALVAYICWRLVRNGLRERIFLRETDQQKAARFAAADTALVRIVK